MQHLAEERLEGTPRQLGEDPEGAVRREGGERIDLEEAGSADRNATVAAAEAERVA